MDTFKVEQFELENPGQPFPAFRSLSVVEAEEIRRRLTRKLDLERNGDGLRLVERLESMSYGFGDVDPRTKDFDLERFVEDFDISPNPTTYINWYRFDDIDEFAFKDLCEYLHDIWYPSEDVEVFDATLSWFILLTHYGRVKLVKLDRDTA